MNALYRQLALAVALGVSAMTAQAEVVEIDAAEAARLTAKGIPLIDIRTEGEWKSSGVIAGSRLLTFFDAQGRADPAQWLAEARPIAGPEQPLILICRSGKRTRVAAQFLSEQAGYKKVYHVSGGIGGWVDAGRPLMPYRR